MSPPADISFIVHPLPVDSTKRCKVCTNSVRCGLSAPGFPPRVARSVVWFREGDLRVQDHPGFESACEHTSTALAPLLVCTPTTPESTLASANRLHRELVDRGSRLFIRYANDEAEGVIAFSREYAAERVHVRCDVETEARAIVNTVEDALRDNVVVDRWVSDLRDWDDLTLGDVQGIPDQFPDFLKWSLRKAIPRLPFADPDDPTLFTPSPDETFESTDSFDSLPPQLVQEDSRVPLWKDRFPERFQTQQTITNTVSIPSDTENFGETQLRRFLQRSEQYQEPDFTGSLAEIFRQGALSPRRMRQIVLDFERENGRVFFPIFRDAAKMVLNVLDATEFSTLLARRDVHTSGTVDGEHKAKFWRWNGFLVRYVEEGIDSSGAHNGKPPLLLIHGFGASSFHFQKSLSMLKEKYHVFAVDLIGFGRSDKPPTFYTSAVWEEMIWDFVRNVVRQPVYVAGNSIGGYFACAFGSDAYGELCKGICLINSAGRLTDPAVRDNGDAGKDNLAKYCLRRWRWTRMLAGRLLLWQLQGRVDKTLKIAYPTNPVPDSSLAEEIVRASEDFGAVEVIASGLILPIGRSLNDLLNSFRGPLLVFNGLLDPLGNVKDRTKTLKAVYPDATIVTVQAGHCPHDEVPEKFCEAVSTWMDDCYNREINEMREVVAGCIGSDA